MIVKRNFRLLVASLLLAGVLQACAQPADGQSDAAQASRTPAEVPTWTPRPVDLTQTALPTSTSLAPVLEEATATLATTGTPAPPRTPKQVTISISGGNLNVRRGPSVDYNYVGVLYDGDTAIAIGRDRISRWVLIELPSQPGVKGWVTTETEYSHVQGDVSILPFVTEEPASPAYIRNCTKHSMLVLPNEVELLTKFDEPYNEERFGVGTYWVYDLENPANEPIQEINLFEGTTVDIRYDWTGDKSKCE